MTKNCYNYKKNIYIFIVWKKAFLNSYEDDCFKYMIHSDNQKLIHHIHCFGCNLYHQSMIKKFCWFQRLMYCDLCFGFYWLNASNISYLTKHICIHYDLLCNDILIHTLYFLCTLLSFTINEYIFCFNPTNSLMVMPTVSSFFLATINLLESS